MNIDNESKHPGVKHMLVSRPLPAFDAADWTAVATAFRHTHSVPLRQYWLDRPQPEYLPATVRTGWTADALWVYAVLSDRDIYNEASKDNEHAWCLGDVFEIFLREYGCEPYVEYHITPDNVTLQLHFPSLGHIMELRESADKTLADLMVAERPFDSWTRVEAEQDLWYVLARVPAPVITGRTTLKAGDRWRYSFCRYDYSHAADKPVLSSTSCHEKVGFHRHPEWGMLEFSD